MRGMILPGRYDVREALHTLADVVSQGPCSDPLVLEKAGHSESVLE